MALSALSISCQKSVKPRPRVLVFSKTEDFRHSSIEAGQQAIMEMGEKYNFQVDTTENDSAFFEENLKKYNAVIFLNTTGDILNAEQQNNFERFIQAGGGWLGIHAATDTEYDWPWYGKLAGAWFKDHPGNPNVQEGEYYVVDSNHPACDSLPAKFTRADEFYNFKKVNPDINVLLKIDESTYTEGNMGDDHPMSWYHEFDGGRSFYTNMGHTIESFSEPLVLNHIWGGLKWVLYDMKPPKLDYTAVKTKKMPEENRFQKVVLDEGLNEPMQFVLLPNTNVLFIERHGAIKLYDQKKEETRVIDSIKVSHQYKLKPNQKSGQEAEDGLLGVSLDPNFKENHFMYLYYSPIGEKEVNSLIRVEFKDEKFDWSTKKVVLEVPLQRDECCHTGGSMAWDNDGNLYLSTGDNTSPRAFAYGPNDERPGRSPWDAQKSSGNTNDLRGKILRIHPEEDGTYTIPEGNLFPMDMEKTRPEIYTMGNRNPYRISLDKKTGYLYWGEVGPDANNDSLPFGSRGYDELNQARKAGFFGWPYFVGNNYPYVDYDFASGKSRKPYDPKKPINDSPNNTGLNELPPVSPAFIWYPYAKSEEFPLVGSGSRNAMAGPVFYSEDFQNAERAFPDYFDKKLLIYDWMRGWIMAITMNEEGDFEKMEPFMGSHKFSNPIDMAFAENGDLYILEYGTAWFSQNPDARLVRIEYNGGNREPIVKTRIDKKAGAVPFTSKFSARGIDYDYDKLAYKWEIISPYGKSIHTSTEPSFDFTFEEIGIYEAVLTVDDGQGGKVESKTKIQAGNEPPELTVNILNGNSGFFFPGQTINYEVLVTDKEDGSLASGGINPEDVSLTIDYLPGGLDAKKTKLGHQFADEEMPTSLGKEMLETSDCKACHKLNQKSIGPTYLQIANKYKGDPGAPKYLANKIKNGGKGVWGEVMMAAHPDLPDEDVSKMVGYILSLAKKPAESLPLKGSYTTRIPKGESDQGVFILKASYTDKGANGLSGQRSQKIMILRNANLSAAGSDASDGIMKMKIPGTDTRIAIAQKDGAWLSFEQVDLSGISAVSFMASAPSAYGFVGGTVEVRLGAPDGKLIGESSPIKPITLPEGSDPRSMRPQIVSASLEPTNGIHDVYFVCKNAGSSESLFTLMQVMFKGQKPSM